MICFLVPVKSKKLSNDWTKFSALVNRTLKSINGQLDKDFQIIVSCHELPEDKFEHPKVHYLQVGFDPPKVKNEDWEEDRQIKEADKARKILSAYEHAVGHFNVDYFMVVDSDDCIHHGISKYVNSRVKENVPGWFFNKGYFYVEGKKMAWKIKSNFNVRCGTSSIVRQDLFRQMVIDEPFLYYFHEKTEFEQGIKLVPYPVAGAIYSMANNENHYMSSKKMVAMVNQAKFFSMGQIQSIISKLTRYSPRFIGDRLKKTYTFYHL